jgi:hypothetical protein
LEGEVLNQRSTSHYMELRIPYSADTICGQGIVVPSENGNSDIICTFGSTIITGCRALGLLARHPSEIKINVAPNTAIPSQKSLWRRQNIWTSQAPQTMTYHLCSTADPVVANLKALHYPPRLCQLMGREQQLREQVFSTTFPMCIALFFGYRPYFQEWIQHGRLHQTGLCSISLGTQELVQMYKI